MERQAGYMPQICRWESASDVNVIEGSYPRVQRSVPVFYKLRRDTSPYREIIWWEASTRGHVDTEAEGNVRATRASEAGGLTRRWKLHDSTLTLLFSGYCSERSNPFCYGLAVRIAGCEIISHLKVVGDAVNTWAKRSDNVRFVYLQSSTAACTRTVLRAPYVCKSLLYGPLFGMSNYCGQKCDWLAAVENDFFSSFLKLIP